MYVNIYKILFKINRGIYKYIGEGSSRVVYDMRNGYVIKIAKDESGIAQNMQEANISFEEDDNLFAKVIWTSTNYRYLIMEKGTPIRNFKIVWKYFNEYGAEGFENSYIVNYLKERYDLVLGDLKKNSSWGIIDNRPVLIDYGFTRQVREKYY